MKQAGSFKDELRKQAEDYKKLYIKGEVSKEQAEEMIQPYLNVLNYSIRRIGKAYRMYIKEQTFEDFMKYKY